MVVLVPDSTVGYGICCDHCCCRHRRLCVDSTTGTDLGLGILAFTGRCGACLCVLVDDMLQFYDPTFLHHGGGMRPSVLTYYRFAASCAFPFVSCIGQT